jgi:hypothetical protein
MNEVLTDTPAGCQAGPHCDRVPCFHAWLEATAGGRRVRRHADICAGHLGSSVHAITAWARHQGATGTVTVLAIDRPAAGPAPAGAAPAASQILRGFAFGTITLRPQPPSYGTM